MSTEQDKDTLSLKRNRGGDGGLDGLGGPGVLLGSPDKKRRKSNTQATSFPPLSEYAPPLNPSADHLVASNPFDDGYNTPSFKPVSPGNLYSAHAHYSGLSSYGPHRMTLHLAPRGPSPYGNPYQMRNQLHPFAQNQVPMGFSRPPGFHYGHQEYPPYGNQPVFSNNMPLPPSQSYRPGSGDNFPQIPTHNMNRSTNSDVGPGFGLEGSANVNLQLRTCTESSPGFMQQQNNIGQSSALMPKQECETMSKNVSLNTSPRKHGPSSEDNVSQDNAVDLKPKHRSASVSQEGRRSNAADKLNGIIPLNSITLKNSPQQCGPKEMPSLERRRRRSSSSGGGAGRSKPTTTSGRPSLSSADPVYPCGMCLNEVKDDQEAIMCEASCQKWFHRICTGMTETAYNLLTAEASAVWGCDACMEDKGAQLTESRKLSGQPVSNSEG